MPDETSFRFGYLLTDAIQNQDPAIASHVENILEKHLRNPSFETIDIGGSDATSFHVDADGNLWLGSAAFGDPAPFRVSSAGALDIGGTDATSFHVDVNGNVWSGAAAYNTATNPFAVSNAGDVYIGGDVTMNASGVLRTAASGERVELTGSASALVFYTGDVAETSPPVNDIQDVVTFDQWRYNMLGPAHGTAGGTLDSQLFLYGRTGTTYSEFAATGDKISMEISDEFFVKNTTGGDLFIVEHDSGAARHKDGSASLPSMAFIDSTNTGLYRRTSIPGLSRNYAITATVGGSDAMDFGYWNSSDTDIDSLLPGSTAGGLILAPDSLHLTFALKENGVDDTISFISGGGNWSSDNTWDTLILALTAQGQAEFAYGTAADPSITFNGDNDTGLYRSGTDVLAVSVGGDLAFRVQNDNETASILGVDTTSRPYLALWSYDGAGTPALQRVAYFGFPQANTTDPDIRLYTDGGSLLFGTNSVLRWTMDGSAGDLYWGSNSNSGGTTTERINLNRDTAVVWICRPDNLVMGLQRTGTDGTVVGIYNDTATVGSISVSGSTTAYNTTSDLSLKGNVRNRAPRVDLDTVRALRRVDWEWNADGRSDSGFLAQEVAEIIPGIATEADFGEDGTMWVMDYGRLTPWLVGAVQDLADRVEQLERTPNAGGASNPSA